MENETDDTPKVFGLMARHLVGAMFLLEDVALNRSTLGEITTFAQCIAKGREIRAFLTDNGFIKAR